MNANQDAQPRKIRWPKIRWPRIMKKITMEEQVLREMYKDCDVTPKTVEELGTLMEPGNRHHRIAMNVTNNFYGFVLLGARVIEGGGESIHDFSREYWTRTHRESTQKEINAGSVSEKTLTWHSQRYLDETPEQFFRTLGEVVVETGVDLAKVREYNEARGKEGLPPGEITRLDMAMTLTTLPAYIRMLELGYNQMELG